MTVLDQLNCWKKGETKVALSSVSVTLDEQEFDKVMPSKMVTGCCHSPITHEDVSQKFAIGLDTAKKTQQVTAQRGIRHAVHPMHRRCRTDHLDPHRKRLKGPWFMDAPVAKHQSPLGNKIGHVITNGEMTKVCPVKDKTSKEAAQALEDFCDDVGVPETLWTDGAKEYVG